jgi:hypothetical protein
VEAIPRWRSREGTVPRQNRKGRASVPHINRVRNCPTDKFGQGLVQGSSGPDDRRSLSSPRACHELDTGTAREPDRRFAYLRRGELRLCCPSDLTTHLAWRPSSTIARQHASRTLRQGGAHSSTRRRAVHRRQGFRVARATEDDREAAPRRGRARRQDRRAHSRGQGRGHREASACRSPR